MDFQRSRTIGLVFTILVGLWTPHASAQQLLGLTPRLDAVLTPQAASPSLSRVRVIVSARSGLLPQLRLALTPLPVGVAGELPSIEALVVEMPSAVLGLVAALPMVQGLSIDAVVRPTAVVQAAEPYTVRGAVGLGATSPSGAGVGVAIIDSGIAPHPDLVERLSASFDFRGAANGTPAPAADPFGHGTHVAGLVASSGRGAGSPGGPGTAPGARLVSLRVLESDGSGATSDVVEALQFAVQNRTRLGLSVVNLSLGHPIYEPASRDPLVRAVQAAVRNGLTVVVSAGNRGIDPRTGQPGYGGISSPGNAPSAITVGAIDTRRTLPQGDDVVTPYSSRGPSWYDGYAKPDLVAPGHRLLSTASAGSLLAAFTGTTATAYQELSGTSMAAPVVSGVVAAMIAANRQAYPGRPDLTPNAVKGFLQFSTVPVRDGDGRVADPLSQGAGSVNAAGAIDLARHADPAAPAGTSWLSAPPSLVSWIGGQPVPWTGTVVWAATQIGGRLLDQRPDAFDNGTVWGSARPTFRNVVWSDDVVWDDRTSGTNVVWSNETVWGPESVGTTGSDGTVQWGTVTQPGTTVWAPVRVGRLLDVVWALLALR